MLRGLAGNMDEVGKPYGPYRHMQLGTTRNRHTPASSHAQRLDTHVCMHNGIYNRDDIGEEVLQ
jgi:hypothetical protein